MKAQLFENEEIRLEGEKRLETVIIKNNQTGDTQRVATPALFSFIGAEPSTGWLNGRVATNDNGFLFTGMDLKTTVLEPPSFARSRDPFFLETSLPGVFGVGDVRAGSFKRVASAVGEGSVAIKLVHKFLNGRG